MMKIQVAFIWGKKGAWVDFEPSGPIHQGNHPDDVLALLSGLTIQEGAVGIRVITDTDTWTFRIHPTWGIVPRLEMLSGEVVEVWPLDSEVGKIWKIQHVLPDGNILPMMYVQTFHLANVVGGFMAETPTTVQQWNWWAQANQPNREMPQSQVRMTKSPSSCQQIIWDCSLNPVTMVSYLDAMEFAKWAGVDLPTDEQWLLASGMSPSRKYPWGDQPPTLDRCHSSTALEQEFPDQVYGRPQGASPSGCLDMVGNVWEMCKQTKK